MSFLRSLFGLEDKYDEDKYEKLERIYPPPNANEAEYQKDALDALNKGVLPSGLLPKATFVKKKKKSFTLF
jgi:hypothetical protein